MLAYCAEQRCLMLPVHFNTPYCGYIERRGGTYAMVPSDEFCLEPGAACPQSVNYLKNEL